MAEWLTIDALTRGDRSATYRRGAQLAMQRPYSQEMIAFIANLDKPTENPQHKDLTNLEDLLHGYYGYTISQLKLEIKRDLESSRVQQQHIDNLERSLDEYKNREAGSKRNKRAAPKNRRSSRKGRRRN